MPRADKKVVHKYQRVLVRLEEDILSGKYKAGQKLPSEATLIRQFQTSRITVGRAIRELGNKGLITGVWVPGRTFVRKRQPVCCSGC